jgi:hypothetical protein
MCWQPAGAWTGRSGAVRAENAIIFQDAFAESDIFNGNEGAAPGMTARKDHAMTEAIAD